MMGSQVSGQERLFYSFNLDDHVPSNHLLRGIDLDLFLDLDSLREHLAPFYSHTGRPSIDPGLMVRMLIVGYCFGIRSERRLCEEVHLNLAYRWFCRLGLEDQVPDHSTFSKNRHGRFRDSDTLRHVFKSVLRRCMSEGLIGGEGFAVDASVIKDDASRARGLDGHEGTQGSQAKTSSRAMREYLDALEASAPQDSDSSPVESAAPPKRVSPTDPPARWTAAPGGPAFYAYSTNYLIDLRAGIIVDVEATPAYRSQEVDSAKTMIDRVEQRFQLKPQKLAGDTAYGTASLLDWMVQKKAIEPHVPVRDKSQRTDQTFSSSDFKWDETVNEYRCPQGHALRSPHRFKVPHSPITKDNTIIYRASPADCSMCVLKSRCCPNTPARRIKRSIYEEARDVARAIATTWEYRRSRRQRKKVEMLFAHLKRILKLDRLRLRGLSGAQDEFLLAATAQNLRRMAKWLMPDAERPRVPAV